MLRPRTHERTDRYATTWEDDARQRVAETWETEAKRQRAERHQRDLAAAYLGAERIAESERVARALQGAR